MAVEDLDYQPVKAHDDIICEKFYVETTTRDSSGRYTVRLLFLSKKFHLGSSKHQVLQRFQALERKFKVNRTLQAQYEKEMNGYLELGHMTLCEDDTEDGYYLPHHAVIKDSSETTKCRVVFDASAKTSTCISLNDVLLTGLTIQETLLQQILRFRAHPFVITADIEKMYRQIWVHPDDRKFQKILWYYKGKLGTFWLNVVTFGVKCAPFLAIRTLFQLTFDEENNFPRISILLRRDFYVDDFLSGADSLEEILAIRDEMIELLSRGGFVIRKWSSNHPFALENIDKKIFDLDCGIQGNPVKKTLEIVWDSQRDIFTYSVNPDITWDESLPQDIHTKWIAVADQLPQLQAIAMPRYFRCDNAVSTEIHGFCDASMHGYGACLFIRSTDSFGNVTVRLAGSKSKVASLSHHTIPRLELAGAALLKKLYVESKAQLIFPIERTILWSDSMIVLCWLKKPPHVLRTYEANRVADIQKVTDGVEWRHVRSNDNPADSLSRGQLPNDLLNNCLSKSGPQWLSLSDDNWPQSPQSLPNNLPGFKEGIVLVTALSGSAIYSRFSDYGCLIRSLAHLLRWRRKEPLPNDTPNTGRSRKGVRYLSPVEIAHAERVTLLLIQRECFSYEIKLLKSAKGLNSGKPNGIFKGRTKFDEINPFLDDDGLIRVGGRIKNSDLLFNQRHPILLPSNHHVSDLIFLDVHHENLHGGIQSTLYAVRERFWVLNGRNHIRHVLHRCVPCIRQKPEFSSAKMADLPESRVVSEFAFSQTGVDLFGPVLIKEKKDRNRSFIKTYGCVFVCMASKAVHIELASDMSTEGFLGCFRRFLSTHGNPRVMKSDNGTNFVGASNELKKLYELHATSEFQDAIQGFTASKRIEWQFNPPLSPHFGGLWEAAVKSFKHHLNRVIKDQKLTYEQLETLLKEIAAVLNSRPLYAVSADPNDALAITPAHLLIGRPFNFLPEPDFVAVPDNRLTAYQFISKARQDFWKKWHKEYLHELQTGQKWLTSSATLTIGSVVVLLEDNLVCARWPLGVVVEFHPGSDGIARVASVKTASGIHKRNITRLCVLPVAEDAELPPAPQPTPP